MMIVNFKTYRQGRGVGELVKLIEKYDKNTIVCLSPSDLYLAKSTKLKVFAQHVDYQEKGKSTGFLVPEAIKGEGAKGSLLNHSEHKVSLDVIRKTLKRCSKLKLKVIVCVSSLREAREVMELRPYAIAFEDPKFIGAKRSITKYGSKDVSDFVELLEGTGIVPICGSGISNVNDYLEALGLGCSGVLISSAIVKSGNPVKLLEGIGGW